jgi:extracellular factor (EF) 3-hydroxypalmitic acid methyl ester biosynthesis protein
MATLLQTYVAQTTAPARIETPLDTAQELLLDGHLAVGLDNLFDHLEETRLDAPANWPSYAKACLEHPIRAFLHQDPFTHRAFAKPRGYAGDAVMMDYIYGLGDAGAAARSATPIGRAILQYMDTRPSARAVRYRRRLLARLIDAAAANDRGRIFALAAGHLREVELSDAMRTGRVQEFVAVDQDEASLAVVARDYARFGVQAQKGSVRQILSGRTDTGEFDLVYAAGLFDYLAAPVAAALTCRLFEMTRPGGTLLIPNFLPDAPDRGYMESFMDWHLIYRNHADMRSLVAALPPASVEDFKTFDDDDDTIVFLQVTKRA